MLALRKPDSLLQKTIEVNVEKKLVRKTPVAKQVADGVAFAKTLPRILTY